MIKINNLTKKYKDKLAVDNLKLEIKTGELFSWLGTNGAGKTTTIKMLSTLILPTSGEVEINNLDFVFSMQNGGKNNLSYIICKYFDLDYRIIEEYGLETYLILNRDFHQQISQ